MRKRDTVIIRVSLSFIVLGILNVIFPVLPLPAASGSGNLLFISAAPGCIALAGQEQSAGVPRISKHGRHGIQCESCHEKDQTAKRVTMPKCFQCHGSYEKVAELTRKDYPNPHKSHEGAVRCRECHKEHGESVNSCNECHTFKMKVP